jgi:hypothetical protein
MAKVFGVQMKAIKKWESRDGFGLSANVYLDNKKVGTYFDNGDGSMPDLRLDNYSETLPILKQRAKQYFEKYPVDATGLELDDEDILEIRYPFLFDEDAFIEEVLRITENEKICKKEFKKGFKIVVLTDYPTFAKGAHPVPYYGRFIGTDAHVRAKEWMTEQKQKWPLIKLESHGNLEGFIIE